MSRATCTDAEFIRLITTHGMADTARHLCLTERAVHFRRRRLEQKLGGPIDSPAAKQARPDPGRHPQRVHLDVPGGTVLVGSDAHLWPGADPVAWRAFVKLTRELKPAAVILNGDVLDFPTISRHDSIGWETHPTVRDEIEFAQRKVGELEDAAFRAALAWPIGNHDIRFETRLASRAPELKGVAGTHLKDHFPAWRPCWSVWVNDSVIIKHRFPKGGAHATSNNPLWAGKSTVQGHLHSAQVRPFTDYNGTRYGVDAGCLADTDHKAFTDYTEDGYKNWRSGFCVLTFHKGQLLMPELVLVFDETHVQFRGQLIEV